MVKTGCVHEHFFLCVGSFCLCFNFDAYTGPLVGTKAGARGAPAGRGMPVAARWQGLRGRGSMRGLTNR